MVTLTLPFELRALAKANQKFIYALMFQYVISTLKDFGLNDKALAAELAMKAVLYTHTRRLDYHPHLHIVVPGGASSRANISLMVFNWPVCLGPDYSRQSKRQA
jgi:hypothetical protein